MAAVTTKAGCSNRRKKRPGRLTCMDSWALAEESPEALLLTWDGAKGPAGRGGRESCTKETASEWTVWGKLARTRMRSELWREKKERKERENRKEREYKRSELMIEMGALRKEREYKRI